ncbi:MAG: 4-alpha-glucanotransferase [Clostridiales bacterium]|nr:4-alpha-glucanotransferase [Clostridiales bacterium]
MNVRESGMLLHITSLPEKGGIGTLGQAAYDFVDFLADAGMKIWQVLPVGPTGYGDSPYQSTSTYAGNPMLIDLKTLENEGLLPAGAFNPLPDSNRVDYEAVRAQKEALLHQAYGMNDFSLEMQTFAKREPWVETYALFMALKMHFGGGSWMEWPQELRMKEEKEIAHYQEMLKSEIGYHIFVQWIFRRQWNKLRSYANKKGVKLFGDMPIYVAEDSADAWGNPEIFQFDASRRPVKVAGVPPDYFSEDGQLWGNPLYDWKKLSKRKYDWWIARLKAMGKLYDLLRVDHFIGFANYYAIPFGATNARIGKWHDAPGHGFFRQVRKDAPEVHIIAEDLGEVNDRVKRLLKFCGYPGMKVLTFAFGGEDANPHLPQNHTENSIVYTGTHDNNTVLGWWADADEKVRNHVRTLLNMDEESDVAGRMIEAAFASVADTAIIPMQDFLRLGGLARMNTPGTVGNNWWWRMTAPAPDTVKQEIRALIEKYNRGGK